MFAHFLGTLQLLRELVQAFLLDGENTAQPFLLPQLTHLTVLGNLGPKMHKKMRKLGPLSSTEGRATVCYTGIQYEH